MMPNVLTYPLNYKASLDVSTAVMYSVSVLESVTVSCNFVFQLTVHLATVNT